MKTAWQRLIRFIDTNDRCLYGEPILPGPEFDLGLVDANTGLQARVLNGTDIFDANLSPLSNEVVTVKRLLGPLAPKDVPILRCIGLNYMAHIRETGRSLPPTPTMFIKASTAVHDHGANVVIPKIAQDDQADYEGELCIIIGRDAKNVSETDALSYVAGYCAGNDVSARKLQLNPEITGPMPQACFSKGFDTFAPLGPAIVSTSVIQDPSSLRLTTTIDGEVRQRGEIGDLAFSPAFLVHYLSIGTTLQKGSVIMTGTPGGVGSHLKPLPKFLRPDTKMEVHISTIGTLRNGVEFE